MSVTWNRVDRTGIVLAATDVVQRPSVRAFGVVSCRNVTILACVLEHFGHERGFNEALST